jgi:L-rhamnose-H+ transport protein
MILSGVLFALLSGICNGLFSAPMKLEQRWQWENIWLVFILVACLLMPAAAVFPFVGDVGRIFVSAPSKALAAALVFGFSWGFGAICFGLSVHRLGVSLANSLVIGLSSALGSLVPLLMSGAFRLDRRQIVLLIGIAAFLLGVWFCGQAGCLRDSSVSSARSATGYLFAVGSGIMSAVFNIGYALALPIADTGVQLGHSRFASTNCIWLLMLGAGSVPNLVYCCYLLRRNRTAGLFIGEGVARSSLRSVAMGLLWGGSIFLYGAATPRLGDIGPSVGWPLSLAAGLLVANLMGLLLGEWRGVNAAATRKMNFGVFTLLVAILICALSATVNS